MAKPTDVPSSGDHGAGATSPDEVASQDASAPPPAREDRDSATSAPPEGESASPSSPAAGRGWRIFAIVGWVLALFALVAAGVFATWWAPLHVEAQEREAVHATARELALRLTTFEGEEIEAWVGQTQELSTGDYAEEVTRLFDQEFRDALRDAEAVSRGELVDLFVQDIDGNEALAFAVVRQTIVNRHLADPVEDELRMEIALERVDDEWLVSNVAVMPSAGPGEAAPPAPGRDEQEGGDG